EASVRLRAAQRVEVAAHAEAAERLGVGAVLVPDGVERRAGTELPPRHRAAAQDAEVEVGDAGVGERRVRPGARRGELLEPAVLPAGHERLQVELEGESRAERPI